MARAEATKVEALIETGRQRLDELIEGALNGNPGDRGAGGGAGEGIGEAGSELMRLWQEGKEQLAELAEKGGEVRKVLVDERRVGEGRRGGGSVWMC